MSEEERLIELLERAPIGLETLENGFTEVILKCLLTTCLKMT